MEYTGAMIGHCQSLQENSSQFAILILRQSRQEEQRKVKDKMSAAMPQCFETWCRQFNDVFSWQKQPSCVSHLSR
jgi:hypothetical protein